MGSCCVAEAVMHGAAGHRAEGLSFTDSPFR